MSTQNLIKLHTNLLNIIQSNKKGLFSQSFLFTNQRFAENHRYN